MGKGRSTAAGGGGNRTDLNPGGFVAGELGFWAKSEGSCFLGTKCWSYCQARAGRCPPWWRGEALGMRHPAVEAPHGHTMPRENRDANSLPACGRISGRRCPAPLSTRARARLALSHRTRIRLLLPSSQGTLLMRLPMFHPKTSMAGSPPLPTLPAADGPMGEMPGLRQVRPC